MDGWEVINRLWKSIIVHIGLQATNLWFCVFSDLSLYQFHDSAVYILGGILAPQVIEMSIILNLVNFVLGGVQVVSQCFKSFFRYNAILGPLK